MEKTNKCTVKDVITTVLLTVLLIVIQLIVNMVCMANDCKHGAVGGHYHAAVRAGLFPYGQPRPQAFLYR